MRDSDLIVELREAAAESGLFDALFLAGSRGKGTHDDWSDIDLVGIAPTERHDTIAQWWQDWLGARVALVYFKRLERWGTLINAVADDWLRIDLYVVPAEGFGRRAQDLVRPLHDPDNIYGRLPASLPPHQPQAGRIEELVLEFTRVIGLTPVVLGRGELVTGVTGAGLLRDMLVQLLLEMQPIADRGGILHMSKLLPAEDVAMLEALPYPRPDRDEIIAAEMAIAAEFFMRARPLAAKLDVAWPAAFERAARRVLVEKGGVSVDELWPET